MLLTSYKFGLFVAIAFCVFYLVAWRARRRRLENIALLIMSYALYAVWDWRWCLLLLGVTETGFVAGLALEHWPRRRRLILAVTIVSNLAALGAFKYFHFFADSFAQLLAAFGLRADTVTLELVLPLGISYYVFQNLSYVLDVYRRTTRATDAAVEYALSLSFFPQLFAGPITRPRDLLPQLLQRRPFDQALAEDGLRQILWGLTKKMLIADNIGLQVDHVWANLSSMDGLTLFFAAVLYSIQIYCDFSGYADIAIGTAKLFNLRLSKNFDHPYFSTSLQMFWRRWHMTLANWMRDYVYISLGGSRVRVARQVFNVLLTFLLVGLWHGANWTFLVWGLIHGAYLAVETQVRKIGRSPGAARGRGGATRRPWPRTALVGLAAVLVFVVVTLAWVFFRAPSLSAAIDFFTRGVAAPFLPGDHLRYLPTLLLSAGLLVYEGFTHRWEHGLAVDRWPLPARWAAYLVLAMAVLVFGYLGGRQGIYVQF